MIHVDFPVSVLRNRFSIPDAYFTIFFFDEKGSYVVDDELLKHAPSKMVILHPLPRVDEISTSVDCDPRAAYFRQMENGMFVRMALLSLILGKRSG
jgi:aspartate carbamoyltransferase catalytic subunit